MEPRPSSTSLVLGVATVVAGAAAGYFAAVPGQGESAAPVVAAPAAQARPRVEERPEHAHSSSSRSRCVIDSVLVEPARTVSGLVLDGAGKPAGRLTLRLLKATRSGFALTDEEGTFTTYEPWTLPYTVEVFASCACGDSRRCIDVETKLGSFAVSVPVRTIALDRVPSTLAEGRLVDESGRALQGWGVEAEFRSHNGPHFHPACSRTQSFSTDADGRFRVTHWSTVAYALRLRAPNGNPRELIRIPGPGLPTYKPSPPSFSGRVVVQHGRNPSGAVVRLVRTADDAERAVTVDASGRFSFIVGPEAGEHWLSVSLPRHHAPQRYQVCDESDAAVLHLAAEDDLLEGRFLDARGEPVRATWLRFIRRETGDLVQTITDPDGRFLTYGAAPGEWDVHVLAGRPLRPGPSIATVRGGDRAIVLRAP